MEYWKWAYLLVLLTETEALRVAVVPCCQYIHRGLVQPGCQRDVASG